MTGQAIDVVAGLAAALPVVILFVAVLTGRVSTQVAAAVVLGLAAGLGVVVFGASAAVLRIGVLKGLWLGIWILGVVWPALLLYGVASAVGLERIGGLFSALLPRRRETLLLLAWLFPGFLQGVAGFGTPIAVAAPLLVAAGWSPVRAVVYSMVGYHWSVTFGSMGSSFYMAAFTAGLDPAQQADFAFLTASLLAAQCLAAGAIVLWLDGGARAIREGLRMLLGVGVPMSLALVGAAMVVPAVATLAAGTVGFAAAFVLSAVVRSRQVPAIAGGSTDILPDRAGQKAISWESVGTVAPYVLLLVTALPVFLVPPAREWVGSHVVIAPDFPATVTTHGWVNAAVDDYTPFALLGHPGFYVALAAGLGYLIYRAAGLWPDDPPPVVRTWARSLPKSSVSILLLGAVATVMTDTGMVSVLARGTAELAGAVFPAVAPLVGGVGSFMTGSTTTSNALFSTLQSDVARLLEIRPSVLLAAQSAGGNIGNSVAPVVALVGLTTIGQEHRLAEVLRRGLPPAAALFLLSGLITVVRA